MSKKYYLIDFDYGADSPRVAYTDARQAYAVSAHRGGHVRVLNSDEPETVTVPREVYDEFIEFKIEHKSLWSYRALQELHKEYMKYPALNKYLYEADHHAIQIAQALSPSYDLRFAPESNQSAENGMSPREILAEIKRLVGKL